MMELTFVTIEDGRECIVLDEFELENNKYVVLVNSLNKDDFILRKVIEDKLIGFKNEEELQKVMIEYLKRKTKEENNE